MGDLGKYRISLKFSEKDADQLEVVQLLKQMGRRKSKFITKAVKYYLENEPEAEIPMPKTQNINKNTLRSMIMELLQEMDLSKETSETLKRKISEDSNVEITEINVDDKKENTLTKPDVETIDIDESDLDDFLDGLNEF